MYLWRQGNKTFECLFAFFKVYGRSDHERTAKP